MKNKKLLSSVICISMAVILLMMPAFSTKAFRLQQLTDNQPQTVESDDTVITNLAIEIDEENPVAWSTKTLSTNDLRVLKNFKFAKRPAIFFEMLLDNRMQRGVAIRINEKLGILHLTTDTQQTRGSLIQAAKDFVNLHPELSSPVIPAAVAACNYSDASVRCNCVTYARCRVPGLPSNRSTLTGKVAGNNHYFPRVGSIATMDIMGGTGHDAYVKNVRIKTNGELEIKVDEANYIGCTISERTGTPAALKVVNYYDPAYPAGNPAPKLNSLSQSTIRRGVPTTITANGERFDPNTMQVVIFGGWCDAWGKCMIANNGLLSKTANSVRIPLTLNNSGQYFLYIYNQSSGKTTQGIMINVP